MLEKNFLNAADVAEYMSVSKPMAYKIIHRLNAELNANGYLTVSGKVNRLFFEQKVNGFVTSKGGDTYASLQRYEE